MTRFYRDGFRSVGLEQILEDVGISKTAFYKHFDCKETLMVAVLEWQSQWLEETFRKMVRERGGDRPVDQLWAVFDVVKTIIEDESFHGCIFVAASMDFPVPHDPVHQAAARSREVIEQIIVEIADAAGASDPEAMTKELCMIIEGTFVTRPLTGNRQTIEVSRRLAERVIEGYLKAAAV